MRKEKRKRGKNREFKEEKEGKREEKKEITSPGYSIDPAEGMPVLVSVLIQLVSGNPAALVWLLRCPGPWGHHLGLGGWRGGVPFYGQVSCFLCTLVIKCSPFFQACLEVGQRTLGVFGLYPTLYSMPTSCCSFLCFYCTLLWFFLTEKCSPLSTWPLFSSQLLFFFMVCQYQQSTVGSTAS